MPLSRFLFAIDWFLILQSFVFFPIRISLCFTVIYYIIISARMFVYLWKVYGKRIGKMDTICVTEKSIIQDLQDIPGVPFERVRTILWLDVIPLIVFATILIDYLQILVKHCLRCTKTIKASLPQYECTRSHQDWIQGKYTNRTTPPYIWHESHR